MTLTQTSALFRRVVKVFGTVIVVAILARTVYLVYGFIFPQQTPTTPAPVAIAAFGPLPPLVINTKPVILKPTYSIQLDLYRASLPASPGIVNVYPILKAPYGFLSEDRAKNLAATFGFNGDPQKLSTTENVWTSPNKTLKVNAQSLNFTYEYNYGADTSVFVGSSFSSRSQIESIANTVFSQHGIFGGFADDLANSKRDINLLTYKNQRFTPTSLISDATAARIDLSRDPVTYAIGNLELTIPFVSPNYIEGLTNTVVTNKGTTTENPGTQTLLFSHTHWKFQRDLATTYPIITSQQAWENIQQSPQSFIVYVGNSSLGPLDSFGGTPEIQEIITHDSYLAYLNPYVESDFIQPVWVFTGVATLSSGGTIDWVAYVPAISPEYVK
ncbi:hypothetical protein GW793_01690 [bacterium]|uniref:Uncharacterized protein n=1 Tax=candidate division WWE3 bacterium CG_4_9_14_3_um_filter_39_7 TaxID=1975080 RepID=A0A2M7X057_UNCKA|nr:hypothetical protein [bacterium]PJA39080.1 MAG: hypothetical protein CO179_05920 [candidate division WWE3 bacterium CG_4_9_14_3_um_filter_39_7]